MSIFICKKSFYSKCNTYICEGTVWEISEEGKELFTFSIRNLISNEIAIVSVMSLTTNFIKTVGR